MSRAEIAAYLQSGYLVVPDLSDAPEIARLQAMLEQAFAPGEEQRWARDRTRDGRSILDRAVLPSSRFPLLARTRFYRRARAVGAQLLEASGPRLVCTVIGLRKVAGAAPTEWHQHIANSRPVELAQDVTVWMPLEESRARNGCLRVVRESPLDRVFPHDERGFTDARYVDRSRIVRCELAAGDGLVIHERLVHGSDSNRSRRPRFAIALYCYRTAVR